MALGQIIALVMVNKCVKFHRSSFNSKEVMAKVKVCHNAAYGRLRRRHQNHHITSTFCPKTVELKIKKNTKNIRLNVTTLDKTSNRAHFISVKSVFCSGWSAAHKCRYLVTCYQCHQNCHLECIFV